MGKWDPYSRRELRRRRVDWLRRNLVVVTVVVLGMTVTGGLATWLLSFSLSGGLEWYVFGAMHAGLLATAMHMFNSVFLASDREALWHVRGAWGEENTRDELRRARRRRLVWGWVDSISFKAGDLDHVVITRQGGLVAIDSKWRNQVTRSDTTDMARSAQKARQRAEALTRTLLKVERGARHRARTQPLSVTPVVVLGVPHSPACRSMPRSKGCDSCREGSSCRGSAPWMMTRSPRKPRATCRES